MRRSGCRVEVNGSVTEPMIKHVGNEADSAWTVFAKDSREDGEMDFVAEQRIKAKAV